MNRMMNKRKKWTLYLWELQNLIQTHCGVSVSTSYLCSVSATRHFQRTSKLLNGFSRMCFEMYLQEDILAAKFFKARRKLLTSTKNCNQQTQQSTFNQQTNSTYPLFLSSTTNDAIHHISYKPQSSNWLLYQHERQLLLSPSPDIMTRLVCEISPNHSPKHHPQTHLDLSSLPNNTT